MATYEIGALPDHQTDLQINVSFSPRLDGAEGLVAQLGEIIDNAGVPLGTTVTITIVKRHGEYAQ